MRMTQHKINRKIKEMGMSIYGYLVLLYFFLHPKPNLLLVAQYSVHKVLSIWICGLLGNDLKKKKNTAVKTNQSPLWKVKGNLL